MLYFLIYFCVLFLQANKAYLLCNLRIQSVYHKKLVCGQHQSHQCTGFMTVKCGSQDYYSHEIWSSAVNSPYWSTWSMTPMSTIQHTAFIEAFFLDFFHVGEILSHFSLSHAIWRLERWTLWKCIYLLIFIFSQINLFSFKPNIVWLN